LGGAFVLLAPHSVVEHAPQGRDALGTLLNESGDRA
jgi:hypothetical protein